MVWMLNKHACGAVEVLGINSKQVEGLADSLPEADLELLLQEFGLKLPQEVPSTRCIL